MWYKDDLFITLCFQGQGSDTITAESGSDVEDPCSPTGRRSSSFTCLAPVHEEVSSCSFNLHLFLKCTCFNQCTMWISEI